MKAQQMLDLFILRALFIASMFNLTIGQASAQKYMVGFQTSEALTGKTKHNFKDSTFADFFWNKNDPTKLLNSSIGSAIHDKVSTAFSEIAYDFLGPIKLTLTAGLSASPNDTLKTTQTFLLGMGNLLLRGDLPLAVYCRPNRMVSFLDSARIGSNLPGVGTKTDSLLYYGDGDLSAHFMLMGEGKKIGLVGNVKLGVLWGDDGFVGKVTKNKKAGAYYNASLGLIIPKLDLVVGIDFPMRFLGKEIGQFRPLSPTVSLTKQIWDNQ